MLYASAQCFLHLTYLSTLAALHDLIVFRNGYAEEYSVEPVIDGGPLLSVHYLTAHIEQSRHGNMGTSDSRQDVVRHCNLLESSLVGSENDVLNADRRHICHDKVLDNRLKVLVVHPIQAVEEAETGMIDKKVSLTLTI